MKTILIVSPVDVTTEMISSFVTEAGGQWRADLNQGFIEWNEEHIWIDGDTSLDPYQAPEDLESLKKRYSLEPKSVLSIEVTRSPDSTELAHKIALKMVNRFQGCQVGQNIEFTDVTQTSYKPLTSD